MRSFAAALVGLSVVAGSVLARTPPQGGPPASGEPAAVSVAADALAFENRGVITDSELASALAFIGQPGAGGDSQAAEMRRKTLRALGRLERRDLIGPLLPFTSNPQLSETAHLAVALILRAHARADRPDDDISRAVSALLPGAPPAVLGQLPYSSTEQFETAQGRLVALLESPQAPRAAVARALEALARRNRKLGRLNDETVALLKKGAAGELPFMRVPDDEALVRESFAALFAAGAADAPLIEGALGDSSAQVRRLGALALFGTGATISDGDRTRLVRLALADRDWTVRFDGLRAWIRGQTETNGCGPLTEALSDASLHLVLAAIDALGDRCVAGGEAEALTARLVSDLRTPPDIGSWHREAHALVAAAKRAPERAAMAMPAFRNHNVWQVRMYAARAAEVLKDVATLEKLAYDANDNVREATLLPLQRLSGAERSQAAFIAALGRTDYQLVRTAALGLKGQAADKHVMAALVESLGRITAQRSDTSRDTRLALMERIREAGASQAAVFERLLTDFDPRVAADAAAALQGVTGVGKPAVPRPLDRGRPPSRGEMEARLMARVELDSGRSFDIRFDKNVALLAYTRIERLVRRKYYDGLTFHRVVPNFVVQGGSPGANEYAGDALYMRDELSVNPHSRGTVGLSTRGHHTGDAQIFINLADNRTLDFDYTIVGNIDPPGMAIVDTIQEGTRITRMQMVPQPR